MSAFARAVLEAIASDPVALDRLRDLVDPDYDNTAAVCDCERSLPAPTADGTLRCAACGRLADWRTER